ncbi:MAG TPA: C-type lectin domain-containing protein [Polyangium sp.]|nr:C-type lectin domain-containing protein [Polyangium sp.]
MALTSGARGAYARHVFVRAVSVFASVCFLGCGSSAKPPQSPTTVTVPAAAASAAPEITGYHCDGNPFHIGDKDYCAYDLPSTWREAQRSCEANSSRLMTFDSDERVKVIHEAFGSPLNLSAEAYWIGLFEPEDQEGNWLWVDGTRLSYSHWNDREPNDTGHEEDCAEWKLGPGSWNDAPCWVSRRYICMQVGTKPLTCLGTLVKMPKGDICFSAEALDWSSAKESCQELGGILAVLSTQEKDATLHKAIGPKLGLPAIWIGYNDLAREGRWSWTSGSRFEFEAWKDGEPNDFHDEDCAEWFPEDGLMNDLVCSAKRPYVCEKL